MKDIIYVTVLYRSIMGYGPNLIEGRGQYARFIDPDDDWSHGGSVEWLTGHDHGIGISKNADDEWRRVPEKRVPNKVWAEIARRALLGEGEN